MRVEVLSSPDVKSKRSEQASMSIGGRTCGGPEYYTNGFDVFVHGTWRLKALKM